MDETRSAPLILVVDDERHTSRICEETLQAAGYATAHAYDGAEAMEWLAQNPPPALIVLDIMMPRMDGFQVVEQLRRDARWKEIPVVVLTSIPSDLAPMRNWTPISPEDCIFTWLYKPFDPEDLIETVRWTLSDRTSPAPEMSQLSPEEALNRLRRRHQPAESSTALWRRPFWRPLWRE